MSDFNTKLSRIEEALRRASSTTELRSVLSQLNAIGHEYSEELGYRVNRARYHLLRGVTSLKGASLPGKDWVASHADALNSAEHHIRVALTAIEDPVLDTIRGITRLREICAYEAKVVESTLRANGRPVTNQIHSLHLNSADRPIVQRHLQHAHVLRSRF